MLPEALQCIADAAGGDARRALSDLERCLNATQSPSELSAAQVVERLQRKDIRHDKNGEDHYNVMSALIKSMRGSDPDAALYWLARLIAGGEPATTIGRRLIVFASEDIGNADPRALSIAVSTAQAVQLVGMPEARIPLAQAVAWLLTCPKSNASYTAINQALTLAKRYGERSHHYICAMPRLHSWKKRGTVLDTSIHTITPTISSAKSTGPMGLVPKRSIRRHRTE